MAGPDFETPRVAGVILAAGRSARFGADLPKQLHRIGGQTLVHYSACVALGSQLRRIVVVTGHRGADVGAVVAGLAVEVVHNPNFADGQSTSVKAGLAAVASDADAVLFIPCDLPNLDVPAIDRLIEAYAESRGPIVVPVAEGKRRAPVLIDRSLFGEIDGVTGDRGARQIFPAHEDEIVEVVFDSALPFEDLDRPSASPRGGSDRQANPVGDGSG
ncbi:MAG: NTP transferase domain-containing protein [Thermoanaerobaculia bacterium]